MSEAPAPPPWFDAGGLLDGVSEATRSRLLGAIACGRFAPGEIIMRFGEPSTDLLYVVEGEARVFRPDGPDQTEVPLSSIRPGYTMGETTFVSRGPRTATVQATTPLTVWRLPFAALDAAAAADPSVGNIYRHIAEQLAAGRQEADDGRVAGAVELSLVAKLLVTVICIQSGTLLATGMMAQLMDEVSSSTIILVGYLLFITAIGVFYTRGIRLPREDFGVTLAEWRPALRDAAVGTLVVMAAVVAIKWALVTFVPAYHGVPIFDVMDVTGDHGRLPAAQLRVVGLSVIAYTLAGGFQELYARGMLQGQLYRFFRPRTENPWLAILVSNLLFASIHVSWSMSLMFMSFGGGLFWGWLYARRKTLLGVTLSHIVLGVWIGKIVNLLALFRFGPFSLH